MLEPRTSGRQPMTATDLQNQAPVSSTVLNHAIAERFREAAALLETQAANPFRVSAYRRAADTVAGLDRSVEDVATGEGLDGLVALPGIGRALAAAILEMVETGRWRALEAMRGELDPTAVLRAVPGIGPALANQIHDELDINTLEELELAAHDGRLETLRGIGPRRAAIVRDALARMLARLRPSRPTQPGAEPPVELILDVDREYRAKAGAGKLTRIAPRRFNPANEAWLPILHTERGPWHFTALYSNTARAHELGRTHDWVVIYFHTDHDPEVQRTVVTETRGSLVGQRVVRGRELECRELVEDRGNAE